MFVRLMFGFVKAPPIWQGLVSLVYLLIAWFAPLVTFKRTRMNVTITTVAIVAIGAMLIIVSMVYILRY